MTPSSPPPRSAQDESWAPSSDSPETTPGPGTMVPHHSRLLTWPVLAWGLWDWGSAAFNAVITTFVFTVYLTTNPGFGNPTENTSALSLGLTVAGACIALLAPVTGQRADRQGRTVFWLGVYTAIVVAVSASLYLIIPEHRYLWAGITLLGVGNIFFELAGVNYNGLLNQLTTKDRVGAVSGLGWGMGYLGGIVLMLLLYYGLIKEGNWFGVSDANGLNIRVSMLVAAAWLGLSALPLLLSQSGRSARRRRARLAHSATRGSARDQAAMESEPADWESASGGVASPARRESVLSSYRRLWRTLVGLYRSHPEVLWFLLAAAIYRDGLAGVFTYGGIIAKSTFGFTQDDVLVFAIVANVVAGVVTIVSGYLDDLLGPRRVIMGSLAVLVVMSLLIFALHDGGPVTFWALGLLLSSCVGPAQSASRTFLARLIPKGREGEIFGLYATTGRAASFLAPAMYGVAIWGGAFVVGKDQAGYWGILGIVLVLVLGMVLMLRVSDPKGHITDLD